MKRKQKRYESEQEIIDCIDAAKAKLTALRKEADNLDRSYEYKEHLKNIEKKCRRIEDATLPHLKNALAAFRTETMPFLTDKAVVLQ